MTQQSEIDSIHLVRLEAFLEELHAGRMPDRQAFLAAHPELAEDLACLVDLDQLAVSLQGEAETTLPPEVDASTDMNVPTIDWASASLDTDKYEMLAEIGRGGMGVVFKARQKDLDRIVALKMILSGAVAADHQVARFYSEARAAAQLKHPHIVPIFDVGQIGGQPYFAMQFIDGPSLSALLRSGKMDAEDTARIVSQVARAIAYLHQQGIVHRDMKPDNILFDEKRHPYVTDFGLVKTLADEESRTTSGAIMGTPSYMAPEQAAGKNKEVSAACDIYSLGAILYECLTGQPPFRGKTTLDTLVQVLESEPPAPRQLNPNIPRALERICLRCLEKSPDHRYPNAAALADDLDHYLRDEPIEHQQTSLPQIVVRWTRREPALAARMLALLVVVTIIQINYFASGRVTLIGHLWTLAALAAWLVASLVFQRMLRRDVLKSVARRAWSGCDVLLIAVLIWMNNDLDTPVVIGFPLVIAGSGLWFRVNMVWFTTVAATVCYALLYIIAVQNQFAIPSLHHGIIFMAGMVVMGYVLAYQVKRVRALSRYYEQRPLP